MQDFDEGKNVYTGDMNIEDVRAFLTKWNTPLVYDIHHFTLRDAQKKVCALCCGEGMRGWGCNRRRR